MRSIRHNLFLPTELSARLEALVEMPGTTKSAIVRAALEAFLDRAGTTEVEEKYAIRLDRISAQLGRIERNGHIGLESLALFVRYMLTINAPLADDDEAARAIGRDRFEAFVERVGRTLASGRQTFDPEILP